MEVNQRIDQRNEEVAALSRADGDVRIMLNIIGTDILMLENRISSLHVKRRLPAEAQLMRLKQAKNEISSILTKPLEEL